MKGNLLFSKVGSAITIAVFFSLPVLSHADTPGQSPMTAESCSYEQAQNKMMQFSNIMQAVNLEVVKRQAKGDVFAGGLHEKVAKMGEESSPLNEKMGAIPNPESIKLSTQVDPTICMGYDRLIQRHGKASTQAKVVQLQKNPTCDQTSLWTRYGKVTQAVTKAFQEQKITRAEVDNFRVLDVQIGQYSTTDLNKACEVLKDYESRISTIQ